MFRSHVHKTCGLGLCLVDFGCGLVVTCSFHPLSRKFRVAKCIFGLVASLPIIQVLEKFNRALQGQGVNISGMLEAAEVVKKELQMLRSEESFKELFEDAKKAEKWNLDPLVICQQIIPATEVRRRRTAYTVY